jgi:hypothetical protein
MKAPTFSYQQLLGSPCDWNSETAQSSVSDNSSMQLSPSRSNSFSSDSAIQIRREANNARERIRVKKHRESFNDLKDTICRHMSLGKDVSRLALLRSATELIKKLEGDLMNANQNVTAPSSRNGSVSGGPSSPVSAGGIDLRNLQISQGAIRGAMADFQAGLPHAFVPSLNNVDPSQLFNHNIHPQVSVAHAMQYQHPLHLQEIQQQNMVNHPFEYTL